MSLQDLLTELSERDKVRSEARRAHDALASFLGASDAERLAAYDRSWEAERLYQKAAADVRAAMGRRDVQEANREAVKEAARRRNRGSAAP